MSGIYVNDYELSKIIDNGGGTLRRHVDPHYNEVTYRSERLPESGYFVGVHNIAVVDAPWSQFGALRDALENSFTPEHYRLYPEQYFLGFWRDENSTWYVDVAEHFTDLSEALSVAEANGEEAIFVIDTAEAITTAAATTTTTATTMKCCDDPESDHSTVDYDEMRYCVGCEDWCYITV